MPTKKAKKKAQAGNSRGFATTSIPAKLKEVLVPAESEQHSASNAQQIQEQDEIARAYTIRQAEEHLNAQVLAESAEIVDNGTRTFTRLIADIEVEKRARKVCIQLSIPEKSIERIITLAREQDRPHSQRSPIESMKSLYTGELLLRRCGLGDDVIQKILLEVPDAMAPEELLYHLVLHTKENIIYASGLQRPETPSEPISTPPRSPPPELYRKNDRTVELLSDEEDQEAIEQSPTLYFVKNQLNLLSLRSRVKKDKSLLPQIKRVEKRARVIELQLGFDRQQAAWEVQREIQNGYLERAAPLMIEDPDHATQDSQEVEDSDSSDDGWLSVQDSLSRIEEKRKSTKIQKSTETDLTVQPQDQEEPMARKDSLSSEESDNEALLPDTLFNTDSSPPPEVSSIGSSECPTDLRQLFPLILPKSSSNISPIKLLQTHLKRADKQAREEFYLKENSLILRFSSSKMRRRKVAIKEPAYRFPDEETAKNYLSLKALFSVPELMAEKAGTRFGGVFRAAWKLLEEEEERTQNTLIASKVDLVRRIHGQRTVHHVSDERSTGSYSTPDAIFSRSSRNAFRDCFDQSAQQTWEHLQTSGSYLSMLRYRETLPIAAYRHALMESIHNNQVTILCGETGCGKSTQLPTYILEHSLSQARHCKIYVTEPRRISAISLANRVSSELGENKKAISSGNSLLGFSIRLDSQVSDKSKLIYATTGIVLRMLEDNRDLDGITHLVIDEVHERSIESDFLLIVVKRLLHSRRDLKVILMSATLQADRFNDYFGGHCSIFNVPGRTYPVEQSFLEDAIELSGYICEETNHYAQKNGTDQRNEWEIPDDQDEECGSDVDLIKYSDRTIRTLRNLDPYKVNFDLICRLLEYLEKGVDKSITQAILIFLPGMGEIRRLLDMLQAHKVFGDRKKWTMYALHSSIASEKQQAAFDVPPRGIRKIVIATNIAETGITIPDITCVIDAGKHKESRFDARRQLNKLSETFISKANAKQRMGRAGRVQPGICYHLFSRARFQKMADHQLPELQRLNLDELALRVKTVQMGGIEEVLLEALDAPTPENVKRSINNLIEVGALDGLQNLTPLGKHLAKLPVDATLGKLILYGVRYSCLDPCLVIAAVLSSKSPFEAPMGREREAGAAKQMFVRGHSDFLTMWTAYSKWRTVCQERPEHENKFCRDACLSQKGLAAIEELRLQNLRILVDSGLLQVSDQDRRVIQRSRYVNSRDGFVLLPADVDANTSTPTYIEACLAAAFFPNLINLDEGYRSLSKGQNVSIHSSSVNTQSRNFPKRWMVFYSLLKTKVATSAHDTGIVDDYIVALFCGTHFEVKPYSGTISLDRNLVKFATRDVRTLLAIALLRQTLERHFADFLNKKELKDEWLDVLAEIVLSFEAVAKQKLK